MDKILEWCRKNPTSVALTDKKLCEELNKTLSHEQDAECPYCKKLKCSHWFGFGWKKN